MRPIRPNPPARTRAPRRSATAIYRATKPGASAFDDVLEPRTEPAAAPASPRWMWWVVVLAVVLAVGALAWSKSGHAPDFGGDRDVPVLRLGVDGTLQVGEESASFEAQTDR